MLRRSSTGRTRIGHRGLQVSALALLVGGMAGAAQAQSGVEQLSARSLQERLTHATEAQGFSGLNVARDGLRDIGVGATAYTPPVSGKPSLPGAGYVETGKLGDPASWVTDEFKLNYGLGQMNAQYAYARGLTGKGVQMGIIDDGVEVRHTEFAGRQITSINSAETLADGTRCAETRRLDGCWYMRGDQSQAQIANGIWVNLPDLSYGGQVLWLVRVGHGTHVAGIMGGNRDNNGSQGVAYGANISTGRIFGDTIGGQTATGAIVNGGLCAQRFDCYRPTINDSVYTNMNADLIASGVRVVNNSWGLTLPFPIPDAAFLDLVYGVNKTLIDQVMHRSADQFVAAGVISVFAAGNGFGSFANFLPTLPRYIPEAEPYWLAVANIDQNERIHASSSLCGAAAQWCVSAAGARIWSAQFGSNEYDMKDPGNLNLVEYLYLGADGRPRGFKLTDAPSNTMNGFQQYTGTSMAAPQVTGAMTLLFERFPYLEGTFVRDILLTTARDIGAPGVDSIYGWGVVDLRKAIEGPGQLIKDSTVNMTTRAGGAKVWSGDAWDAWTNNISGVGRLTKTGPGWLRLTGNNTFNGLTLNSGILELTGNNALGSRIDVTGGALMLGGRLSNTPLNVTGGSTIVTGVVTGGLTTVGAGGSLFGTGTLGDLTVNGSITPGMAVADMGRLSVSGNYVQNPGSVFNVAVRPVGNSGLLSVLGTATITGGTLNVLALPGLYQLDQNYRVLNASGGLTGRFSGFTTSGLDLPFLAFGLDYDTRGVDLSVDRGVSFASVAQTANQKAVAGSVDGMANSSSVLNAMSQLTLEQGRTALTQTSGEAYAGMQGAAIDGARSVREAVLGRHLFAQDVRGERGVSLWGDARRATGEREAGGGYARTEHETDLYLIGADVGVSERLTVGGFAGWGRTDLTTTRATDARSDNAYLGVYGATTVSGVRLSVGAAMSTHDADVDRSITVTGMAQRLRSKSDYQTRQAYVDAGVDMPVNGGVFQPFAQYVRVDASHDGVQEAGGSLALSGTVNDAALDIATVGVRFATRPTGAESRLPDWLQLRGSAGYRLIGGDRRPTADLALPTGGAFTVGSANVGAQAFVAEAAASARVRDNARIEAGYSGQFGDRGNDHVGNIRLVVSF